MNCKEIQMVTKYGGDLATTSASVIEEHLNRCASCKSLLLSERLAPAIIRAASASSYDGVQPYGPYGMDSNAMLIGRIKRRIQEIRDQRSSSWEAAVEATSGWLAAFAVAAIILVVGAMQWRPSTMASDLDLLTQNADEHIISDVPGPAGASKDNSHVDK
jgi:predicted anti-sigma-YlaC factor YlaD